MPLFFCIGLLLFYNYRETLIKGAAIDYAARKSFAVAAKLTEWGDNRFNRRFPDYWHFYRM